jgi:hypothetical protein
MESPSILWNDNKDRLRTPRRFPHKWIELVSDLGVLPPCDSIDSFGPQQSPDIILLVIGCLYHHIKVSVSQ